MTTLFYRHVLLELKIPFQVQVGDCTFICFIADTRCLNLMEIAYIYFIYFFQSTNGSTMRTKRTLLSRNHHSLLHFFLHLISTQQSSAVTGWIEFMFHVTFSCFFVHTYISDAVKKALCVCNSISSFKLDTINHNKSHYIVYFILYLLRLLHIVDVTMMYGYLQNKDVQ